VAGAQLDDIDDRSRPLAVLGGGAVGLSCAWRAAEAGIETVVVGDRDRYPAASAVAAGMIAPVGEASWGEERLLAAALAAADAWPAFAAELADRSGHEVPHRRCGALHVALDRDEAAELRRRAELHRRLELDSEPLLPGAARRLEPGLSSSLAAAVAAPGEAEVDPRALLAALETACSRAGVRVVREAAAGAGPDGISLQGGGSVAAETVLVAAGAWSGGLGGSAGRLPVRPVKGEILRLRADPGAMPCDRIIAGERFYVVPRADGEVVVGATVEERGFDTTVTAGGVHELLREAYRALPELAELELVETAAGLRPGTPDNAPIVGRLDETTLVATGMYRNGIMLAPLVADAVVAILESRSPSGALADLGPGRFASASGREEVRA
jgi:glycine oxidase